MNSSQLAAGQRTVSVTGEPFVVNTTVDLDLVRVVNPPGDALVLASGSTGRIGRIEIETRSQDGIKVQNAGNVCHDMVIESGCLRALASQEGAHQDGIQVMGGRNITFRNLNILGFNTQGIFVNTGGSGASVPANITIDRCYVGPSGATAIMIGQVQGITVTGCHVWKTFRFGRGLMGVPVGNNVIHDSGDPFPACGATPSPPPTPPPTPPPGDPCAAVRAELTAMTARALTAETRSRNADILIAQIAAQCENFLDPEGE